MIDQLTKQINDAQQVQAELIEKQVKQHADFERQRAEDKKNQEKISKENNDEFEKELQLIKSKFCRTQTKRSIGVEIWTPQTIIDTLATLPPHYRLLTNVS